MAAFKYILLVAALLGAASASRLELNGFSEVSLGDVYLPGRLFKYSDRTTGLYYGLPGIP